MKTRRTVHSVDGATPGAGTAAQLDLSVTAPKNCVPTAVRVLTATTPDIATTPPTADGSFRWKIGGAGVSGVDPSDGTGILDVGLCDGFPTPVDCGLKPGADYTISIYRQSLGGTEVAAFCIASVEITWSNV